MDSLNAPLFPDPPLYYTDPNELRQKSTRLIRWVSKKMTRNIPGARERFQHVLKVTRWVLHLCVLFFMSFAVHVFYNLLPSLVGFVVVGAFLHYTAQFVNVFKPQKDDSKSI